MTIGTCATSISVDASADAGQPSRDRSAGPRPAPAQSEDTRLAVEIRELVERGSMDEARERFAGLVAAHQRRASRIAYQYLRDIADADEAVQDAFVKVFTHIGVLSRGVAVRGLVHAHSHQRLSGPAQGARPARSLVRGRPKMPAAMTKAARRSAGPPNRIPKHACSLASAARTLAAAIDRLDGRQRTVFMLCHYGDCTPREVSAMTGLNESTVRVHLFRAARKLRGLLGGKPMIGRAHHLTDERLLECYLAERGGEPLDPPAAEHLTDCDACADPVRGAARPSWTAASGCRSGSRRRFSRRAPARAAAADLRAARAGQSFGARHQLPGPGSAGACRRLDDRA